jgi:hypothetical protein
LAEPVDLSREGNRVDMLSEHDRARDRTSVLDADLTPFPWSHLSGGPFVEAGAR